MKPTPLLALATLSLITLRPALSATFPLAPAENAPNIAAITPTTVRLITGETRSFTVDSPREQASISTAATVAQLTAQFDRMTEVTFLRNGSPLSPNDIPRNGDKLQASFAPGTQYAKTQTYDLEFVEAALVGRLTLRTARRSLPSLTANAAPSEITLDFTAGQRTPNATVAIVVPVGINITMDNTYVNVIGRGEVPLSGLATQSIGRTGTNYSYKQVGQVTITNDPQTGVQTITFTGLDLRPLNKPDLRIRITGVQLTKPGDYFFAAVYKTTEPKVYTSPIAAFPSVALLTVNNTISDFARVPLRQFTYTETPDTYTSATFTWAPFHSAASDATIQVSTDTGKNRTWKTLRPVNLADGTVTITGLDPDKLYAVRLTVATGPAAGDSNMVFFHTSKQDIKSIKTHFGGIAKGDGSTDDTNAINEAIALTYREGGGTLRFPKGTYNVRTLHLLSNVWLYLDPGATIQCIGNCDAPEPAWFSDRDYRAGTSPTASGPYREPENWLTKQDVGHTYFQNAMFTAERQDNIKIIGAGRITGNDKLSTSDKVMDNPPEKRADKMFSLKLCTNIEIAGLSNGLDLWYDEKKDEPYYIAKVGGASSSQPRKQDAPATMLNIDRAGHFVLLATGCDDLHIHDTYLGKAGTGNARDIYDFMACNNVTVTNIYSKASSDDIVKPGSDCSLGFTRPARNYKIRNIIGDTNCNLFQIGSETADDIQDLYIDNICVLAANKAGFSISTNDGAHIKNVYLNSGKTGPIHSRSKMLRTRAPFFISISNRGRIIGADATRFKFTEAGATRDELLCTNVPIGQVENIIINGIDCSEVYGTSSYNNKTRWTPYDGKQNRATPIIAGFKLPDTANVQGGLDFKLPDNRHTGYITNIQFTDVHILAKGGNPASDRDAIPPELGVGKYNIGDLKTQPAYGFWFRHVKDILLKNCSVAVEKPDARYAIVFDDVNGAHIENLKYPPPAPGAKPIKAIATENITAK